MRRLGWTRRLFGLLFAACILSSLELLARAVERSDRLGEILRILEQHPVLLWRQRPYLDEVFAGERVVTDGDGLRVAASGAGPRSAAGAPEILVLGASPTFGWGVTYEQAYPARIEQRLHEHGFPRACVLNGGMVGWSSLQGRRLLEGSYFDGEPQIALIDYVINDVDSYRFFRSDGRPDGDLQPASMWSTALGNLLARSALFRTWAAAQGELFGRLGVGEALREVRSRPGDVRVSIEDYRSNLTWMVRWFRDRGTTPVLVVLPVNLPRAPAPGAEAQRRADLARIQGRARFDGGDCAGAVPHLREVTSLDPLSSDAAWMLAVCARRAGDGASAALLLERTQQMEGHRCAQSGLAYNQAMREVAAAQGVLLVDLTRDFAAGGAGLWEDPVTDPIHPSPDGHILIADRVVQTLLGPGGPLVSTTR